MQNKNVLGNSQKNIQMASTHTKRSTSSLINNLRNWNWNNKKRSTTKKGDVWESRSLHILKSTGYFMIKFYSEINKLLCNKKATEHWKVIFLCEFPKSIFGSLPNPYSHININHRMEVSWGIRKEKYWLALCLLSCSEHPYVCVWAESEG